MLSEQQLNALPERIYQRLSEINTDYLNMIGGRIKEIGGMTPSDIQRVQQMYYFNGDVDEIARKLANASDKNIKDIYDIFDIVARDNYSFSKPFYEARGLKQIPFEDNEYLQNYCKALAKQTAGEYVNITQHTVLSDTYTKIIDKATTEAQMGLTSYSSAMRKTLKELADAGIMYKAEYASGYHRRLDTAVRQNILWGIKQCNQGIADMVGEQFGADGYEISLHSFPRPTHENMGGRQYAIGSARTVKGKFYESFDNVAGLLEDYGCLHFKFSILLGISVPSYNDKQLAEYQKKNKEKFEYEGVKYTGYEATQVQRRIETAVRHQQDRAIIAKAAGDDELRRETQVKINQLTEKYKSFSNAAGLPVKAERMKVLGFRKVKTKDELKHLTNVRKSDIIKETGKKSITLITDKAIEKVPKFKIDGFTDAYNAFIQQQHKDLLAFAKDNNNSNEVAFVFRNDLTDKTVFIGDTKSVILDDAFHAKGNDMILMHNHPHNSGFSYNDLIEFVSNDSIKLLSIVKNNGSVEIINKSNKFDKTNVVMQLNRSIKKNIKSGTDGEYRKMINSFLNSANKKWGVIEWIK